MRKSLLASAVSAALLATASVQAAPTMEEMWEIIQRQQAEIENLKSQIKQTDQQLQQTEVKVEATADAVESARSSSSSSLGSWVDRTTIGGYGELHYNNLDNELDAPWAKDDQTELDFHRFVFFVGYEFDEKTRFFSEVELEHALAGDGKEGEVELEQAYIERDLAGTHKARVGQFLIPVGILNETHEPDTFYGVERNPVEKNIIPTTWWDAGFAFNGELVEGFSYDFAVTGGLGLDPAKGKYKVRDGRQKVAKADAHSLAYTSRIKYTGIPGLELALTSQYQEDLYQGDLMVAGQHEEADAWLWEAHAVYETGPFSLRALYAQWNIDDSIEAIKPGADEQTGFYVEPGYRFNENLGIFARYSEWDNQAGSGSIDSEYSQIDLGINWWIHEQVVIKFDIQDQDTPDGKDEFDGFNLGVGFSY